MAARRRTRARDAQIAFEALSIEGGLLSPEWLSKIAQLQAGSQSESDYRIPKGLNVRDEIGRYWRIAQAHWIEFDRGRKSNADSNRLAERFVSALLRDALGFSSLTKASAVVISERSYPIGHAALAGRVPVVISAAGKGLDTSAMEFGDGGRRRTAFGLAQEYLNAQDGALWGIACDGVTLRIARDNASLTRPAWIEADLARIFTEERYADFGALWLLLHETRFGRDDQQASDCPLERWRNDGREEGTRAREHLRGGVEEALIAFGQGFLAHPSNGELRANLQSGALATKDYFNQLLRLVYRMIFLLTVEERGLLHPPGTSETTTSLYAEGYAMRRIRERSVRRNAHDRFSDLWEAAKIAFLGLASGEPRLGLPALAGIFAKTQCPALDAAKLENRWLLLAMFKLAWLREEGALARVNWRDMGPEELGSVYESLLELVPQITQEGRQFAFATGGETKGNARKTTGSYYTPDSLVQVLLDSALEPVVAETVAKHPDDPIEALLGLSIVDPACGSGHFLLAAARRLAAHVARLRANGTPSAAEYRHALRQVVGHCIYGVDLNPMAVELCKVSLWMEAVEPGLPLTFLDAHIQHGNALLGTTPELMAKGIPDKAWDPIEGDDKKIASALKKRNRAEAAGQRTLQFTTNNRSEDERMVVAKAVADLEDASDASVEALAQKESQWDRILASPEYRHQKFVADAWCAAFVWPKQPDDLDHAAPTNEPWRQIRDADREPLSLTTSTVRNLSQRYAFFHWQLQFPMVFEAGGFNVVLGNPPWDRITFEEREWFAERSSVIAEATTAAHRRSLIAELEVTNPSLRDEYLRARRDTAAVAAFCDASGHFPRTAVGHFNTYAVFAELAATNLVAPRGRAAILSPTAIVTGDYSKAFTRFMLTNGRLQAVFDFDNRSRFFPAAQPNLRFALVLMAGKAVASDAPRTRVASQLRSVSDLNDLRITELSQADVLAMNPETATMPFFYAARDAALVAAMYRRRPSLFNASGRSSWDVDFGRMLNMSDDSGDFLTLEEIRHGSQPPQVEPVYEAKLTAQYDHRAGTFDGVPRQERFRLHAGTNEPTSRDKFDPSFRIVPRYWLPRESVREVLASKRYFLVYRDAISATADARSLAACFIPRAPSVHTLLLVRAEAVLDHIVFAAAMNSFVLDYVLRQKATGGHAARFIVRQLPFIERTDSEAASSWSEGSVADWLKSRVLELTYTAWDLEALGHDVGYDGPPFRWDPDRRFLLRCELDAAFFHLYGISRDDTDYIMDTFPIVRKNDVKAHNEYRTKSVILEIYDEMAAAARTGKPYQTRLDPPPADARVAHPGSTRPDWARRS